MAVFLQRLGVIALFMTLSYLKICGYLTNIIKRCMIDNEDLEQ